jgi:hypothetical protein
MRKPTLMLVLAVAGCGPTYIVQQPAPPPPQLYGRVSIEVADHREPKKGGADPAMIGNERSGWGIPYPVRLGGPAELAFQVHELFAQEAMNTGIGVLPIGQAQGATSRLIIDIQQYWCDGYPPSFKADAVASAMIIDGATGQVRVPGQPLVAHGEAGSCRHALRRMLNSLSSSARGMFATPQLHQALIAEPGPPPGAPGPGMPDAPPPPPGSSGPGAPPPGSVQQPYGGQ